MPNRTDPASEQQTLTLQQAMELAVKHHTAGNLPNAQSIYQQILQNHPNHPDALHLLGVIAHQKGENESAVDLITKALAIKPDYAEAHNNLGLALHGLGRLDEAVICYHKAFIKPDYAEANNNLGAVLQELGKFDEAIASYNKALTVKPDYAKAYSNLGAALKELGKTDEAISSYQKALNFNPELAEAHNNLGNEYKAIGLLDEAVASYHKAIDINPNYAQAYNNLGVAHRELGKPDHEEAMRIAIFASKPLDRQGLSRSDIRYDGKDHYLLEAVANYHKALKIKPEFAEAYNNLGNTQRELGLLDEAVASYRKALDIKPNFIEVHSHLGVAYRELGRLAESVASFRVGLKLDPDSVEVRNSLGLVLYSQGKFSEADSFYCEALKLTPIDEPYLPYFAFLGDPVRHFWMMGTIALLENLDRPITMLEVGTWLGSSLLTWDQSITAFHSKGGKIMCVDAWKPYLIRKKLFNDDAYEQMNLEFRKDAMLQGENGIDVSVLAVSDLGVAYRIFCHNKNTTTCKVEHCRGVSKGILPGLESASFDIVYIDGSHYYDDVVTDIREGCRLVREGGYICGDDLEIQWNDAHQDHVQRHKNEDYIPDPDGNPYHPGVTAAVSNVLGNVTCHDGYWIMQKQNGQLKQVKFKGFDSFIPSHFSTDWKDRFKDYVSTLSVQM